MGQVRQKQPTLCWECAKATGGCQWSDRLQPVDGWEAIQTHNQTGSSYIVTNCPLFKRDAVNSGLKRYGYNEALYKML